MAKTIVITGVTRGIGRGLAGEFDRLGHKVIGCGRSNDQVAELQTALGQAHDFALVKSILREELADILRLRKDALGSEDGAAAERYEKASKIAAHWIKNYTELDFRSLGSYTRADLEAIAAAEDAF